jgi:DNA-binding MarR family transcriptional regulator
VTPRPQRAVLADLESEMATLWQLSRARARELAQVVHPRLDPTAFPLIAVLGRSEAMRPSELVRTLHLDASTVSRQIAAVQRLGLVTRVPDPSDARARLVALTPEARERVAEVRRQQLVRWEASLEDWPAEDIAQLTRLLRRLREGWSPGVAGDRDGLERGSRASR